MRKGRMVRMAGRFYGGMIALALAWGVGRGLWPRWWRFDSPRAVAEGAVVGITLGMTAVLLSWLMERSVPGVRALSERFSTVLAGTSTRDALLLAALSSVGEELIFRGCLQEELGIWVATALFAAVHTGPERVYLWWTASAFVFGLGLGGLYASQGGLLAPVVMHFVINAVNIRLLGQQGADLVHRRTGTLGGTI